MLAAHRGVADELSGMVLVAMGHDQEFQAGTVAAAHAGSAGALRSAGERFLSELERGKETAEVGLVLRVIDRFGLTLLLGRRGGGPLEDEAK